MTDVGKYRILDSRVDAWAQALADAGHATARDVPAEPWLALRRAPEQHARVRLFEPLSTGGLSLVLATTLVDGDPFGLDIGICRRHERTVFLTSLPFCGCDACDDGSTELLNELDDNVVTVARGGVVHARRGDDIATRTGDGWHGHGDWLDETIPVPLGVEVWAGGSWF